MNFDEFIASMSEGSANNEANPTPSTEPEQQPTQEDNTNNTTNTTQETTTSVEDNKGEVAETPTEPEEEFNPEELFKSGKQGQAFAKMRVENKAYKDTISKLAGVLGLNNKASSEEILEAVNKAVVASQAKQMGMPPEMLMNMDNIMRQNQELQALQRETLVMKGFERLKTDFNLDNKGLTKYAMELRDQGINPWEQDIDIVQHYQITHFNDILEARTQQAIKEFEQKQAQIAATSSTPIKGSGVNPSLGNNTVKEINSVQDLSRLFAEYMK